MNVTSPKKWKVWWNPFLLSLHDISLHVFLGSVILIDDTRIPRGLGNFINRGENIATRSINSDSSNYLLPQTGSRSFSSASGHVRWHNFSVAEPPNNFYRRSNVLELRNCCLDGDSYRWNRSCELFLWFARFHSNCIDFAKKTTTIWIIIQPSSAKFGEKERTEFRFHCFDCYLLFNVVFLIVSFA